MRALAIVAALLVLATPFVGAQSGDPSASSSGSPSPSPSPSERPVPPDGNATSDNETHDGEDPEDAGPEDEVQCPSDRAPAAMSPAEKRACYCDARPRDPVCDRDGQEADAAAGEWKRWCRDEARTDAQRERCRRALDDFRSGEGKARRITFEVDAANRTLYDYRIDGRPIFDSLLLDTGSDNLTVQRLGSTLRLGDRDTELALHDDPSGLVRFKASDGSLIVRMADGTILQPSSDGGMARVVLPDGGIGHLRAGNVTWLDASTLLVSDFFAFLLPPAAAASSSQPGDDGDVDGGEDGKVEEKVGRAITDRKVGAEISVKAPSGSASALANDPEGDEDGAVEVLAYDDVDVQVNVPSEVATPEDPIRVRVSADLDEGRTIVLNLDRSVLESAELGSLVLRYYDVYEQADGTEVQTEVVFAEAKGGLEDVLDPSDDDGQPEYWVVEDANGLQVLVSVPHWSAHAITVGSVGQVLSNPSVLIGIAVGLVGSVVAGVAMLWPRRPDEE